MAQRLGEECHVGPVSYTHLDVYKRQLLFDDVPFLEVAQQEHDTFAQILRDQGVEVLYLCLLYTSRCV